MELQLKQQTLDCLKQLTNQIRREEQTQEIKLGEAMPDIGRVLGAWGQVLLRGKQWNSTTAQVSGGVMAWVLYAPEDGSEERVVETWIPFQMKWDLPDTQRDGNLCAVCTLKSMDARSVSARKLLVRACVSVLGRAYEPVQVTVYSPSEVPEDVQVLENSYPVLIPKEAGEKMFELDEELRLPPAAAELGQIIYYDLHPELVDQKVMAGKVVFRGSALLHMLYRAADGSLQTWDTEIPFSQYGELEQELEQEAQAWVVPVVTGLEVEKGEGTIHLHASLTGQYVVFDRPVITLVEDAYSNQREIKLIHESMELPVILDDRRNLIRAESSLPEDCARLVDVSFCLDHPQLRRNDEQVQLELGGYFQTLFYDDEQHLQCAMSRWEAKQNQQADPDNQMSAACVRSGRPQGSMELGCDLSVQLNSMSGRGWNMVSAMELGEEKKQDKDKPSLLLRRVDGTGLWNIAKGCGSTVSAIMQANGLNQEPEQGRMLLVPIM